MNKLGCIALVGMLSLMTAVGCDKSVQLKVINTLPQPTGDVAIQVPYQAPVGFGQLSAYQTVAYTIKVPSDELPAACQATLAGAAPLPFTIDKNTKSPLTIYVDTTGLTLVPKGTTINRQEKIKHAPRTVQEGTVVTPDATPMPSDGSSSTPPSGGGGRIISQEPVVE